MLTNLYLITLVYTATLTTNEQCGAVTDTTCGPTRCCSTWGWCGTTTEYCSTGCQPLYGRCDGQPPVVVPSTIISPSVGSPTVTTSPSVVPTLPPQPTTVPVTLNGRCGTDFGTRCVEGYCCSTFGWCGVEPAHCNTGCQPLFGRCNGQPSVVPSSTVVSPSITASPSTVAASATSNAASPTSVPPQPTTVPITLNGRCGTGFGSRCAEDDCCSTHGWCGSTNGHCMMGCQPLFGRCVDQPPASSTLVSPSSISASVTVSPTSASTVLPQPNTVPITIDGRCGTGSGTGSGTQCSGTDCCSTFGWCGSEPAHCGRGCQPLFGRCDSVPVPPTTTHPPLDPSRIAPVIESCNRPGVFALTFDDGPYLFTSNLLNILDEKGVKATFFLNSNNKAPINSGNYPDIVRRMYNSGHHIGSHTHTHANLTALTVSEMWNEMNLFDQALSGIIGVRPVFMRPPFGEWNTQVLTAMGSWGYRVSWITVDTNDWRHVGQPNAAQLSLNRVNDAINATPTTYHISLAHDTLQETVEQFVSDAIDSIRAKGLQLVTFGDCVGAPPSTWYRS